MATILGCPHVIGFPEIDVASVVSDIGTVGQH